MFKKLCWLMLVVMTVMPLMGFVVASTVPFGVKDYVPAKVRIYVHSEFSANTLKVVLCNSSGVILSNGISSEITLSNGIKEATFTGCQTVTATSLYYPCFITDTGSVQLYSEETTYETKANEIGTYSNPENISPVTDGEKAYKKFFIQILNNENQILFGETATTTFTSYTEYNSGALKTIYNKSGYTCNTL